MSNFHIDLKRVVSIAKDAGKAIMEVYNTNFLVEYKKSESFEEGISPLTKADKISDEIIAKGLKKIAPNIPILSEETFEIPYKERKSWSLFWLVDSLDGTKSFIKKEGDFTVNIALISNKAPILGVVYAPFSDTLYYADAKGAYKQEKNNVAKLPINNKRKSFVVVASKNHFNDQTKKFIEDLKKQKENVELVNIGSSLKFCLVAEGSADIYPRLGPTMEWDTAAAHAIVNTTGKKVYHYETGEELVYNKESLVNPFFVVK